MLLAAQVLIAVAPAISYGLVFTATGLLLASTRVYTSAMYAGLLLYAGLAFLALFAVGSAYCTNALELRTVIFAATFITVLSASRAGARQVAPHVLPIAAMTAFGIALNQGQNENFQGSMAILPFALAVYLKSQAGRSLALLGALVIAVYNSAIGLAVSIFIAGLAPARLLSRPTLIAVMAFPFAWSAGEAVLLQAGWLHDVNLFFNAYFNQNFTSGRGQLWALKIEELFYYGYFCAGDPYHYDAGMDSQLSPHNSYLDMAIRLSLVGLLFVASLVVIALRQRTRDERSLRFFFLMAFYASFETFFLSNNIALSALTAFALGSALRVKVARTGKRRIGGRESKIYAGS